MTSLRKQPPHTTINSVRTATISAAIESKKIRNGLWTPHTELWISRSIYPNRKKIRKQSQPQETPLLPAIRNASSAWRTRDMPEEPIILRERTTGSSRSRSTIPIGDSSILLMYTTMNIVSYLTASILR